METFGTTRDNLPWFFMRKIPRMTKTYANSRKVLDDIAASIKKLNLYFENSETEGRRLTTSEIDTVANELQALVEQLLAASESLRDEKSAR
jgi:hypothetical protein